MRNCSNNTFHLDLCLFFRLLRKVCQQPDCRGDFRWVETQKKKGGMTIFWHRSELGHCRCVYKGLFTTWGKLKGLAWTFPLKRRWATLVFRQVLKRERLHAVRDPCQTDQDLHIFPLMAIGHAELKLKPFSSKITFHGFYLSFVLHVSHSLSLPPHPLHRGRGRRSP